MTGRDGENNQTGGDVLAQEAGDRLTSWKEIAAFLGCDERTAMRWESLGMPVRRIPGAKRGRVYASRREISAWLRGRSESVSEEPVTANGAGGAAKASPWRSRRWKYIVAAALGIGIGMIAALRTLHPPNPQRAAIVGSELTAYDGEGRAIWKYDFPRRLQAPEGSPDFDPRENERTHVEDLNGDGRNEVLAAATYGMDEPHSDELFCFGPGGALQWRYEPKEQFRFFGRAARGPWKLHASTIVRSGGAKTVWASFADPQFAPTFVASIDASGRPAVRYVSSGNVNALLGVTKGPDTFIVAGGVNNEYRAAAVAVLNARQAAAASPQSRGNRFECLDCPSGRPMLYMLLPRSEVNLASGLPYNWVQMMERRDPGILVSTLEKRGSATTSDVGQYLQFSIDFLPQSITMSAGYREAHEYLEKHGAIDHSWAECKEQTYPATVRVWDPARGWRETQVPWIR